MHDFCPLHHTEGSLLSPGWTFLPVISEKQGSPLRTPPTLVTFIVRLPFQIRVYLWKEYYLLLQNLSLLNLLSVLDFLSPLADTMAASPSHVPLPASPRTVSCWQKLEGGKVHRISELEGVLILMDARAGIPSTADQPRGCVVMTKYVHCQ